MLQKLKSLKIIVLGGSGVGKSAILSKIGQEKFEDNTLTSLIVRFFESEIKIEDESYFFQFWDFKDDIKLDFVSNKFYKGANGAVIIFDLSKRETLRRAKYYLMTIRKNIPIKIPFVLVGNKVDLIEDMDLAINRRDILRYAKSNGGIYIEDSLEDLENFKIALKRLNEMIFEKL